MRSVRKVKIYSTPICPFCDMTKKFFKENGIEFQEVNVLKDEKAREEMVRKSKQMSVPVTEIIKPDEVAIIVGFEKEKLKEELDLK